MERKNIGVIIQGFYGNRVFTELEEDSIDYILQGILDPGMIEMEYEPDRTVVKIPDSECVLVYNKYQEAAKIEKIRKNADEFGYYSKPMAYIPQENIEIFSRCFACRLNEDGSLESLRKGDGEIVVRYLAE